MNPSTDIASKTEELLYCPLPSEAARNSCATSTLFYLAGRKVFFRCCLSQNPTSPHSHIAIIRAFFAEFFNPKEFLGFNPWWNNDCEILESKIPSELAEKINKIASAQFHFQEKYKFFKPEAALMATQEVLSSMSFEDAMNDFNGEKFKKAAKEKLPKDMFDYLNDETQKNIEKLGKEVGQEFEPYASTIGISLRY